MHQSEHALRGLTRRVFHACAIATLTATWLLTASATAQEVTGPTIVAEDICMQHTFGVPVTNSNKLNCTANDIRLSRATHVEPDTCISGSEFDLLATFEVNVTANARYDAGFFFRTDGGPNARGDTNQASGECSLSSLTPPTTNDPNPPALQLDGDSCGDLNSGVYEVTFLIPDVACVAAEGTNQLALPNCTSWHSNQGTLCNIGSSLDVSDASKFKPDTKSKCVCDDTFTVPVTVEDAELEVTKSANPEQISEPGGKVTFTVTIKNAALLESVVIDSIIDAPYGNVGTNAPGYDPNTCDELIGDTLTAGQEVSCIFGVDLLGDAGDRLEDTVTVTATQPSNGNELSDTGEAAVDVIDVSADPTVSKDAQSVANCTVDATYQVVVNNTSEVDTLTINSLNDSKFGSLTATHAAGNGFEEVVSTDCNQTGNLFAPIVALGNYTCTFVGRITDSDCSVNHTNEVTADVTDDDGKNSTPKDTANVSGSITPDP